MNSTGLHEFLTLQATFRQTVKGQDDIRDNCHLHSCKTAVCYKNCGSVQKIVGLTNYPLSIQKVEVVNQNIKTIRRDRYGLPDDEYFFLKLFVVSMERRNL